MKKHLIIFTSTSWDNDEFNECWMCCLDKNEDCFNSAAENKNELAFRRGDFLISVMDGNDYCNKIDWDYPKIQQKVESLIEGSENTGKKVHVLVHSDDEGHWTRLKKRLDKPTGLHLYSSATGDLWDYLTPLSIPGEPDEIHTILINLWERLENPPADAHSKKSKDAMTALRHTLAKSKRKTKDFSGYCVRHFPEDHVSMLNRELRVRLEKSRNTFQDCLDQGFLLTDDNRHINRIYRHFEKIETRALMMEQNDLEVAEKISMGFQCAKDFSHILDTINDID
jgi:hypothetical protein